MVDSLQEEIIMCLLSPSGSEKPAFMAGFVFHSNVLIIAFLVIQNYLDLKYPFFDIVFLN